MKVGILVFPEVEILDFAGPFEVFSVATRMASRGRGAGSPPLFEPLLIAETADIVRARHGFQVKPNYALDAHPHIDLLVIPGGVVDQPRGSRRVLDWISQSAAKSELIASVCTGAFLLAEVGLLDGLRVTTHWEDIGDLRAQFPALSVIENADFVDAGRIVTSAGISAGIDMSLHLVARLHGLPLAERTARQMEYRWKQFTSESTPTRESSQSTSRTDVDLLGCEP